MIRRCKYCGNLFNANSNIHIQCGREECKKAYSRECTRKIRYNKKQERLGRLKKQRGLSADALRAKDLGVSYGVYMSLYKNGDIDV